MTRVVVVGSGLAGISAALQAHTSGGEVTLVTKDELGDGNSRYAQGGIAAAVGPGDSPAAHLRDTLHAGAGRVDAAAAELLVTQAPAAIDELVRLGVEFDRDDGGRVRAGLEGAHSHARILHAGGDATGAAIQRALVDAVRSRGIRVRDNAFLVDVVVDRGRACGIDVIDDGGARRLAADAVVLATGGAGQLFAHTTNPPAATADGLAAALRAGAVVTDLEFMQFHPTALDDGTLVSEAVRGEGAVLLDDEGRRFVLDVDPAGELAARDVVARAIADTMRRQGGRPVMLDATRLGADPDRDSERADAERHDPERAARFLATRFPTIDAAVRARGWDWAREPIPVAPGAHYLMGGIVTDLEGRTSVPGLYAAGEVARTGVHGANRLASNSLLEAAVFGARSGAASVADATTGRRWSRASDGTPRTRQPHPRPASSGSADAAASATPFSRAALQRLMWEHVGLSRDAAGLDVAGRILDAWSAHPVRGDDRRAREDANLLLVAREMAHAAAARPLSLGAHHRRDDAPELPRAIAAEMVA